MSVGWFRTRREYGVGRQHERNPMNGDVGRCIYQKSDWYARCREDVARRVRDRNLVQWNFAPRDFKGLV